MRFDLDSRRERLKNEEVRKIVEENSRDYHPDYLRARIIDEQEELHLKRLRRDFLLIWGIFGNAILLAAVAVPLVVGWPAVTSYDPLIAGGLGLSLILSLFLLYRQYRRMRASKIRIKKLNVAQRRNRHVDEVTGDDEGQRLLLEHKRYRDELPEVIADYRAEANRYRKWHNAFQGIIIIGSVTTSAITTASVSYEQARWIAVAVSAVVGLAAGFTGYFKYRERSFNLQQTADAIEREYESVELRVGQYRGMSEKDAYSAFCSHVEHLRDEQNKRQQQLDQPVEVKREQAVQA